MSIFKLSAVVLGSLVVVALAVAQPAQQQQRGGAGVRNFGGTSGSGFSAKNTKDQLVAIQETLHATDEEWKSLSAKVEKVVVAKQNMSSGAGMNWTASNNTKPTFEASKAKPDTVPGKALQAVREALADEAATAEQLEQKIAAVRAARQKARADYDSAQAELIDDITPKQQGILMTLGVLD